MIEIRKATVEEQQIFHEIDKTYEVAWFPLRPNTAIIVCPNCKKLVALINCTIDSDGVVTSSTPSVICPYDCGFHDTVKLLDWEATS